MIIAPPPFWPPNRLCLTGYQEVFYGFDVDAILARDRDEYFAECMDDARTNKQREKRGSVWCLLLRGNRGRPSGVG